MRPPVSALLVLLAGLGRAPWCREAAAEPADVAFTAAADGSEQRYMIIEPGGFDPNRPHDVLVALHGHGSDRRQFAHDPRDECRAARDVARERGMLFVSPDYRAPTSWMGPAAEADLLQILSALRRNGAARIFLCGGSMGGTGALTFAALHPEAVDGVAAMNPTANLVEYAGFSDAIAASFGGTRQEVPDEYIRRSAEYSPESFRMPVGITVSANDTVVPPQSATRLAHALTTLGRPVLLIHRPDAGHQTLYADARAILEFAIDSAPPVNAD